MAELLTQISSVSIRKAANAESNGTAPRAVTSTYDSFEEILEILKSKPTEEQVIDCLQSLSASRENGIESLNIFRPSPLQGQVLHVLVSVIVPDFWPVERAVVNPARNKLCDLLISVLKSVSGIGSVTARLKAILEETTRAQDRALSTSQPLKLLLDVLSNILSHDRFLTTAWTSIVFSTGSDEGRRTALSKEFISLIAGSRILLLSAQAEDTIHKSDINSRPCWLGNAREYSLWLGECIGEAVMNDGSQSTESIQFLSQNLARGLSLRESQSVAAGVMKQCHEIGSRLSTVTTNASAKITILLEALGSRDQCRFFDALWKSSIHSIISEVSQGNTTQSKEISSRVSAVAAFIHDLTKDSPILVKRVLQTITSANETNPISSLQRQCLICSQSKSRDFLEQAFTKSLQTFGDPLFIKHAPVIAQQSLTQTLLLCAGYLNRLDQASFRRLARSSSETSAISNRLESLSEKVRSLGMIVGSLFSKLLDPDDKQLKFDFDEDARTSFEEFESLVKTQSNIGSLEEFWRLFQTSEKTEAKEQVVPQAAQKLVTISKQKSKGTQKQGTPAVVGPKIIEIFDDDDTDENDLQPLPMPDSDPEDDDEDPTLVQRNKPKAPVYIRDLILGLQDTKDHDRFETALQTAGDLIRRKAAFGKEVTDNSDHLATIIMGLHDTFDTDDFEELRIKALIAILVADPSKVAKQIAASFFEGDYSINQRVNMLAALGLGARELAGYKDEDNPLVGSSGRANTTFPSKQLPSHLHELYGAGKSIDAVSSSVQRSILTPVAAKAADGATGPAALKVRTISSRLGTDKTQPKKIVNSFSKLVGDNFFFPLTGRFWLYSRASGGKSVHQNPLLLTPFLRTLGLMMHAAGPRTPALRDLTRELWELLLSLREKVLVERVALEAWLFACLTMLEVNTEVDDGRRLAQEDGRNLIETQEWVAMVFDRVNAGLPSSDIGTGNPRHGPNSDDEKITVLAAGVLVKTQEIVKKYQRMLMGTVIDE